MKIYKAQSFHERDIYSILSDPIIQKITTDGEPDKFFKVNKSFDHLLIENDECQVIGCFQYKHVTNRVVEVHINILPKFWGGECGLESILNSFKWFKINTKYTKVLTDVPANCDKVIELMKKAGGIPCGVVKQGVVYNNILTDLIFFERDINE